MTKEETWTPLSWYCPNCGAIVIGYRDTTGLAKVQCETCGVEMVRRWKGKRHDLLDLYDRSEEEFLVAENGAIPRVTPKSENPVPAKANRVSEE